jgi:hypothetical protein
MLSVAGIMRAAFRRWLHLAAFPRIEIQSI